MKNLLNPERLARNEFNQKLDALPNDGNVFDAGLKLAIKTSQLQVNFENARQANLAVLKMRKIESQKNIIRYIWDYENMNFN